ncbi:MAG: hypothetical protein P9E24_12225 [Candidatus Competibacter sp.]|nr:hypothetical protein [Candidatus Competibacter sp.]MDG4584706.1 hypothetical protein [Candidatus Competibacter sp.]
MNDPRDAEFHDVDLSALYRATRDPEPPAWLDRYILTAASDAPQPSAPPVAPRPRRRRTRVWAAPAALAATVVLAVGLVRLARETGEWAPPPESKALRSLAESAAEADAGAAGRAQSRVDDRPPSAAAPRPAVSAGEAVRVAPPSASAPPALPAAPPEDPMRRSMPLQTAPAEQERQRNGFQAAPAGRRADEDGALRERQDRRSPEEWLAAIAELRRQGRATEAEASLAEFRRRYPDYPLQTAPEPPR